MFHSISIACLSLVLGFTFVANAGCNDGDNSTFQEVGGSYPPVTAKQLLKAKYSHRTGKEKYDFNWVFKGDNFVIEGKKIPQDLLDVLLGEGKTATKVEGTWSISDEKIHFAVKTIDEEAKTRNSKLPIYFTGVIRIESKEAQYVF